MFGDQFSQSQIRNRCRRRFGIINIGAWEIVNHHDAFIIFDDNRGHRRFANDKTIGAFFFADSQIRAPRFPGRSRNVDRLYPLWFFQQGNKREHLVLRRRRAAGFFPPNENTYPKQDDDEGDQIVHRWQFPNWDKKFLVKEPSDTP